MKLSDKVVMVCLLSFSVSTLVAFTSLFTHIGPTFILMSIAFGFLLLSLGLVVVIGLQTPRAEQKQTDLVPIVEDETDCVVQGQSEGV